MIPDTAPLAESRGPGREAKVLTACGSMARGWLRDESVASGPVAWGSRDKFEAALAKVPAAELSPSDE